MNGLSLYAFIVCKGTALPLSVDYRHFVFKIALSSRNLSQLSMSPLSTYEAETNTDKVR